jgi:hypothetical protein
MRQLQSTRRKSTRALPVPIAPIQTALGTLEPIMGFTYCESVSDGPFEVDGSMRGFGYPGKRGEPIGCRR